jgi:hypothetical protein
MGTFNGLRRRYLRENSTETSRGNPVGVVEYKVSNDGIIELTYSLAHPNDKFEKWRANLCLSGRWNKGVTWLGDLNDPDDLNKFVFSEMPDRLVNLVQTICIYEREKLERKNVSVKESTNG